MTPVQAGTFGFAPKVLVAPYTPNPEKAKYTKLWENPRYREVSPGECWAQQFLEIARPEKHSDCIDFGCGTGRGALSLALFGAMKVTMLDFTSNCLDEEVAQACITQSTRLSFKVQDVTKPIPYSAAYGYCVDMMEHIPPEDVQKVLQNILGSAHKVFFGIATVDDIMGELIGEKLHLTVQPMEWWVEQIKAAGATVHWAQNLDNEACGIYCSMWKDIADVIPAGVLNVKEEIINEQTRINILGGWQQVTPHQEQDKDLVLLAGGPSMLDHIDEIKQLRADGCALVTVNGSYNWAIEQGMVPSIQVLLDARPFNKRFTQPQVETCRYLIGSQVHPDVLEGLPKDRTYLWHSGISDENEALALSTHGVFYPVPGGSTVVLRAIPLMMLLGFRRIHIFGFDSCVNARGEHHGYSQPENDNKPVLPVTCGGRTFQCEPWHVSQASEFRDLVRFLEEQDVSLDIRGDGLIAHMLKVGFDLFEADKEREHA